MLKFEIVLGNAKRSQLVCCSVRVEDADFTDFPSLNVRRFIPESVLLGKTAAIATVRLESQRHVSTFQGYLPCIHLSGHFFVCLICVILLTVFIYGFLKNKKLYIDN